MPAETGISHIFEQDPDKAARLRLALLLGERRR